MANLLLDEGDDLPHAGLGQVVGKDDILRDLVDAGEEGARLVESYHLRLLHFLEDRVILDQDPALGGQVQDNRNHAWHRQSQGTGAGGDQHAYAPLDDPTSITRRKINGHKQENKSPDNHGEKAE